MPYKDPIKRKEYLRIYRLTEKYKQYSNSQARKQYLIDYIKTEKCKISKKKYIQTKNGKESIKKARKKYFSSLKGKLYMRKYETIPSRKLYRSEWNKTLKGKYSLFKKGLKRRAAKNNIMELFTIEQFNNKVKQTNNICPSCNKPFDNKTHKLSLDHIFPISKANEEFKQTGVKRIYTIDDVEPLCLSCNSRKRDKIIEPKDL